MRRFLVPPLLAGLVVLTGIAFARAPLSDSQVRQQIIQESIADYQSTGHPSACSYNAVSNGSSCRRRSAYTQPSGAAPLCYPQDVTQDMVRQWRDQRS